MKIKLSDVTRAGLLKQTLDSLKGERASIAAEEKFQVVACGSWNHITISGALLSTETRDGEKRRTPEAALAVAVKTATLAYYDTRIGHILAEIEVLGVDVSEAA